MGVMMKLMIVEKTSFRVLFRGEVTEVKETTKRGCPLIVYSNKEGQHAWPIRNVNWSITA